MNQIYNFYTHGETYKGEEMSRQMNAGLDVQSGTNDADMFKMKTSACLS